MRRAFAVLGALALAAPAQALELAWIGARLPNGPGVPWQYWVDGSKPNPGGLPLATIEAAVQESFRLWGGVSCSYLSFHYQGRDLTHGVHLDNTNVMAVFFTSPDEDPEFYQIVFKDGGAVAAGLPVYYSGTIYECDTALNAVDYVFTTDGDTTNFDLQTTLNHVTGHCLGLDDYISDSRAVMSETVQFRGEERRTLGVHDEDNLCQLYPKVGAVGSPCPSGVCTAGMVCSASGGDTAFCTVGCDPAAANVCPVGFSCADSAIVPGYAGACLFGGQGGIKVGAPCTLATVNADCGALADSVCIAYDFLNDAWRDGYCTADCSQHPCPAGSHCYDVDGASRCLKDCRPGAGECRLGYGCEPTGQGVGRCRPVCRSADDCGGNVCDSCTGLCVVAGSSSAKIGDPCSEDPQCPSGGTCRLDIAGGVCVRSCATTCSACPQDSTCTPWGMSGEQLCFGNCSDSTGCPSGLDCWQVGAGGACKPSCLTIADCPPGQDCYSGACRDTPSGDDGGVCVLCGNHDAGPKLTPDASPDAPPAPSGCGCSTTAGLVPAALVLFLLATPWRPRWPTRR